MTQAFDFDRFFLHFEEKIAIYRKGEYIPAGPCTDVLIAMTSDLSDVFVSEEIVPRLEERGFTVIDVETEDYLPTGTPQDKLCQHLLQIIQSSGISPDALYYAGIEGIPQQHPELHTRLSNVVFFAVENCSAGISCLQHTASLLRETLRSYHEQTTGQQEEYWIDEETIEFLQKYAKNNHIPHWAVDKAQRMLMISYGDPPLCESVLLETIKAAKFQTVLVAKEYWMAGGASEDIVKVKLLEFLRFYQVDLDACYQRGLEAINPDILQLACGIIFFALDEVQSMYDAGVMTGKLLMELVNEEHVRFHPEDENVSLEPDEQMALELKLYAKNGFVPSWVVVELFDLLMKKHASLTHAEAVRDATLKSLGYEILLLDKENYIVIKDDDYDMLYDPFCEKLAEWDMERVFQARGVPPEYVSQQQQLTAMLFFGDSDYTTYEEAANAFQSQLISHMIFSREESGADGISEELRMQLLDLNFDNSKNDRIPSWVRDLCLEILIRDAKCPEWYAELYMDEWYSIHDSYEVLPLPEAYDIGQADNAAPIEDRILALFRKLNFSDRAFADENPQMTPEDEQKLVYLVHAIYFADSSVQSIDEATEKIVTLL